MTAFAHKNIVVVVVISNQISNVQALIILYFLPCGHPTTEQPATEQPATTDEPQQIMAAADERPTTPPAAEKSWEELMADAWAAAP